MHSLLTIGLLAPEECDRALAATARVSRKPPMTDDATFERSGRVAWLPRSRSTAWLFDRIEGYGRKYAERYGIDIDALDADLQYAEYGPNDTIDWHIDTGTPETMWRKVTISVQLDRSSAYEGGDLELVSEHRELYARGQGNAVAFSAALAHRVTRVTKGRRRVLVGWMSGPPWR
jgi:hypothetical protein